MSEAAQYVERLNIREQIARIDNLQADLQRKQGETEKFVAGQRKLIAEADKLRRDRFLAPILAAGALGGFIAAVLPLILRGWGFR